ncbi:hypothetical protein Nepgr_031203 [Nepenthes gracilis]|uniref:Uncharacterized protein n=1 Tax=Nepenthes gracilis TaxID=150966 RepID=A0AAD3TG91_NEPGR|nr:hypothetical protein Nepgr_031203 [Nepenthes gracilis]
MLSTGWLTQTTFLQADDSSHRIRSGLASRAKQTRLVNTRKVEELSGGQTRQPCMNFFDPPHLLRNGLREGRWLGPTDQFV